VSPLSGLTSLTYLDLRYSKVTDVSPLSGLTSLTPVLTSLTYFGA
jgi:internalin A